MFGVIAWLIAAATVGGGVLKVLKFIFKVVDNIAKYWQGKGIPVMKHEFVSMYTIPAFSEKYDDESTRCPSHRCPSQRREKAIRRGAYPAPPHVICMCVCSSMWSH